MAGALEKLRVKHLFTYLECQQQHVEAALVKKGGVATFAGLEVVSRK
jgi:hypothetical protein